MTTKLNKKSGRDFWIVKMPLDLKVEMDRVRIERIKLGKDKQMRSYQRLGLAMARHKLLLKDLVNADFLEGDKK